MTWLVTSTSDPQDLAEDVHQQRCQRGQRVPDQGRADRVLGLFGGFGSYPAYPPPTIENGRAPAPAERRLCALWPAAELRRRRSEGGESWRPPGPYACEGRRR